VIWVDSRLQKEFSTLEDFVNKCIDFEGCWSKCRLRCVHICMIGRTRWSHEPEWTWIVLRVKEVERAWETIYYEWLGIGIHSACFEDVATLSHGKMIWA
jgi:hypothetical protein